jgi:glycosyltransferase involved in cell wall biosynthesis
VANIGQRVLVAWRRQTPPAFLGGAELTEAEIAVAIAVAGHEVSFFGSYENPRNRDQSNRDWLELLLRETSTSWRVRGPRVEYEYHGVRCVATTQEDLSALVASADQQTDLLLTSQEGCVDIARASRRWRVGSFVHSVSAVGLASTQISGATLLVPSEFVRSRVRQVSEVDSTLIRVPLQFGVGRISPRPGRSVLFVNPIRPKGVALASALAAAMPSTEFTFLEGWWPYEGPRLPSNVDLQSRRLDVSPVYANTAVLLVPSQVEEAAGRVVVEAGAHSVPVIASRIGGLPEAVADPRSLLDPRDAPAWEARLRELLSDDALRSSAGREHAEHCSGLYRPAPERVLLESLGLS